MNLFGGAISYEPFWGATRGAKWSICSIGHFFVLDIMKSGVDDISAGSVPQASRSVVESTRTLESVDKSTTLYRKNTT